MATSNTRLLLDRDALLSGSQTAPNAVALFEAGYLLAEVTRLMRAALDVRMRDLGLTGASWRVLANLAREDGLTQIELARRLEVSRVALGQMIDRLAKSGHVERRADARDRRIWRVHLTASAWEIIPALTETASQLRDRTLGVLTNEEMISLTGNLTRLRTHLRSVNRDLDASQ